MEDRNEIQRGEQPRFLHHDEHDSQGHALIAQYEINQGEQWEYTQEESLLFFMIKGSLTLSCRNMRGSRRVREGSMFIVPRYGWYRARAAEDTLLGTFYLSMGTHISDLFPIVEPYTRKPQYECSLYSLPIHETIAAFFKTAYACADNNATSVNYYEFKFRELLFLLKKHYTSPQLTRFFEPILVPDVEFTDFVLQNFDKVKTVKELADLSHYSLSSFKRRFQLCFGEPPYTWMKHQKAMRIFNDIRENGENLKEISDKYDFSSLSQFSTFCKNYFGETPSQIRAHNMKSLKYASFSRM